MLAVHAAYAVKLTVAWLISGVLSSIVSPQVSYDRQGTNVFVQAVQPVSQLIVDKTNLKKQLYPVALSTAAVLVVLDP